MPSPDEPDLLPHLAEALRAGQPSASDPPAHHLVALRAAVAFQRAEAPGPVVALSQRRGRNTRRAATVGAVAASLLMLVSSAAAAVGPDGLPLPRPVRAAADAVGVPVDSVALADTHHHLRALETAIRSNDHRQIGLLASKLHRDVQQFPDDERRGGQPDIDRALTQAAVNLDPAAFPAARTEHPVPAPDSPTGAEGVSPPPAAPAGPSTFAGPPGPDPATEAADSASSDPEDPLPQGRSAHDADETVDQQPVSDPADAERGPSLASIE